MLAEELEKRDRVSRAQSVGIEAETGTQGLPVRPGSRATRSSLAREAAGGRVLESAPIKAVLVAECRVRIYQVVA